MLLVDGSREEVAIRLTQLVGLPDDVDVSPSDKWMPYGKPVRRNGSWDIKPSNEVILSKRNDLVSPSIRRQLRDWWLAVPKGANAPNWDIASTCTIRGKPGLLLVEAKAHGKELSEQDTCSSKNPDNRRRICRAIAEANAAFQQEAGGSWALSRDHHYQLSNRFAWSWKLASLGIPVVLVYLGFLNAQDMADDGPLFRSKADWECVLKNYSQDVVDETCWGRWLDFDGVPFTALIRVKDQPFDRNEEENGA